MIHNQKVLSVSDFSVSFPAQQLQAVSGISFGLFCGRTLAVVGESGSGKSLTALALMGLLPNKSVAGGTRMLKNGDSELALDQLDEHTWRKLRGKRIGMIFQEPMTALNPVQRVGKQIAETVRLHQRLSRKAAREKVIDWLGKVKLPDPERLFYRYPHELSGGQKQRVMIAMAMINGPDILIADEPTTALDASVQGDIILLMRQLQQDYGTAIFFITHDLALAGNIADDIMVLRRGRCVEYGPRDIVLTHPAHPYTQALLKCRPDAGNKSLRLPTVADFESGISYVAQPAPISVPDYTSPLLEIQDLRVVFHKRNGLFGKNLVTEAVKGVSLKLYRGETLGLVGESGCGKSTLGKAILQLLPVSGGSIRFAGQQQSGKEDRSFRRAVQLVFQDPYASLDPLFRVRDIITEPLRIHHLLSEPAKQQKALQLMEQVGLPAEALDKYPHEFSGGQRQRISIARALALEPEILICDESVSALDISIQAQVLNLLKDLQQRLGLSYLFISHDLSVVHYISDRILVMEKGRIVEEGSADQVLRHPSHPYTQKLVASMPEALSGI
ncbi:ABC transporter ATP-binding protein [Rurimicrobium arvi]|uniref:ABC transporter ATP-binding protein n=1 Tax=Rurimicrobium arvi TaxID=2049916 RepID=A0ABP8MQX4_9BACT